MTLDPAKVAAGIGAKVVTAPKSGYGRIVAGKRTLAYCNPGNLDFRAEDVSDAPAEARKAVVVKGKRAKISLDPKNEKAAATLLEHVVQKEAQ